MPFTLTRFPTAWDSATEAAASSMDATRRDVRGVGGLLSSLAGWWVDWVRIFDCPTRPNSSVGSVPVGSDPSSLTLSSLTPTCLRRERCLADVRAEEGE